MLTRCEESMQKVCEDFGAELPEFNGQNDHVHLLMHHPPKVCLSWLAANLKGVSARLLPQGFTSHVNHAIMHGHFWSPSYSAASCGSAPLSIIKEHIENQRRPDTGGATTRRRPAPLR